MELRTKQRFALEGAFRSAAAAEDLQALGAAMQAWHSKTTARAQVSRAPVACSVYCFVCLVRCRHAAAVCMPALPW